MSVDVQCFWCEPQDLEAEDRASSLWRRTDTGEILRFDQLPPGAMWDATWLRGICPGPDGRCMTVRLPNGYDWCTDYPRERPWTRTGEPPRVTARPSILVYPHPGQPGYHGWLTDGVLHEC